MKTNTREEAARLAGVVASVEREIKRLMREGEHLTDDRMRIFFRAEDDLKSAREWLERATQEDS